LDEGVRSRLKVKATTLSVPLQQLGFGKKEKKRRERGCKGRGLSAFTSGIRGFLEAGARPEPE